MEVVIFDLPDMPTVPGMVIGQADFRVASAQWRTRVQNLATTCGAAYVDIVSPLNDVYANPAADAIAGIEPLAPLTQIELAALAGFVIPEPGTALLLGSGMLGLVYARRQGRPGRRVQGPLPQPA